MDSFKNYNKVDELYRDLGLPIDQGSEFTIHSLLELHDTSSFKSPVFRANYYSFVFINEGRGNYTTDDKNFEFTSKTVYFTNPGHLKAFEFYHLADAYLITLKESFLKENVHKDVFERFPFLLAETVPPQIFTANEFLEIEVFYKQILKEFRGDSTYKFQLIGNLLVVILLKLKERFWSDYQPIEEGDRSSQIVKGFKQSLEKHYKELVQGQVQEQYKAKDYANQLNLHPSYLSTVIKSKTGKPVSQWIAEKTLSQAKAFLSHSDTSIKEIGFLLGFSELAHFSNFFKKNTGVSPSKFRKENQTTSR